MTQGKLKRALAKEQYKLRRQPLRASERKAERLRRDRDKYTGR